KTDGITAMTLSEELQQAYARIDTLESQVEALKNPPRPSPDVLHSAIDEGFRMPSARQLMSLFEIITKAVPSLAEVEFAQFAAAFHWLGSLHRTNEVDSRKYLSFWGDIARDWLAQIGAPTTDISTPALMAAAIAHHDIPYLLGDMRAGVVPAIG